LDGQAIDFIVPTQTSNLDGLLAKLSLFAGINAGVTGPGL
jgi:hypothetical protein